MSFPSRETIAIATVIVVTNLLAACNSSDLNRLLNGSSASAGTQSRTRYIPGSEATQEEVNRLHYLSPGQSTQAMHSVLGSPDSFDPTGDYYNAPGGGQVKIPYDSSGKWTGNIEPAAAPQWQAAPYPGAQP